MRDEGISEEEKNYVKEIEDIREGRKNNQDDKEKFC